MAPSAHRAEGATPVLAVPERGSGPFVTSTHGYGVPAVDRRRQDELHRKMEQRKQQFADEWTMRKWTGSDAVGQEAAQ